MPQGVTSGYPKHRLVIDTSCVPVSAPIGAIVTDDPVRPRRHRQGLTPRDPKNCARTLAQSVDPWRGAGFRFLDDVGPDGMALVLAPLAAPELVPDQGGARRPPPSWSSRTARPGADRRARAGRL